MAGTRLFAFSTEIASEQNELLTAEALCNICHPEDFETLRVPRVSACLSPSLTSGHTDLWALGMVSFSVVWCDLASGNRDRTVCVCSPNTRTSIYDQLMALKYRKLDYIEYCSIK